MTLDDMFRTGDIVEFRKWCETASPGDLTSAWVRASSGGLQNIADLDARQSTSIVWNEKRNESHLQPEVFVAGFGSVTDAIKALPGEKLSKRDLRRKTHQQIGRRPLGWLVYLTGAVRVHDDGDGINMVFRWWHPVAWLMVIIMILPCALVGEPLADSVPFRVTKWYRDNPQRLNWL